MVRLGQEGVAGGWWVRLKYLKRGWDRKEEFEKNTNVSKHYRLAIYLANTPHKKISEILPLHSGIIVLLSNK